MFTMSFPRIDGELERLFHTLSQAPAPEKARFAPAVDVAEDGESYTLAVDLPGVKPEDIKISIENGVLTLAGERKEPETAKPLTFHRVERAWGRFERSFTLPEDVLGDKIEARYEAGVLLVALPKRPEVRPRTIEVKVQ